ncbi:MAG: hypothetical protein ABI377_07820 [Devosia sp.]
MTSTKEQIEAGVRVWEERGIPMANAMKVGILGNRQHAHIDLKELTRHISPSLDALLTLDFVKSALDPMKRARELHADIARHVDEMLKRN